MKHAQCYCGWCKFERYIIFWVMGALLPCMLISHFIKSVVLTLVISFAVSGVLIWLLYRSERKQELKAKAAEEKEKTAD